LTKIIYVIDYKNIMLDFAGSVVEAELNCSWIKHALAESALSAVVEVVNG
jgi:hypothetical protein